MLFSCVWKGKIHNLIHELLIKTWRHFLQSSLTTVKSPQALSHSPQREVSGNGFPQEEVCVFSPAQHSVHLEGVGWGVGEGHHALAKLIKSPLGHQLHPHRSDAAFDTERLVDGRILLETDVQLGRKKENCKFLYLRKTSCELSLQAHVEVRLTLYRCSSVRFLTPFSSKKTW